MIEKYLPTIIQNYEVSNYGNFLSVRSGKLLRLTPDKNGYLQAQLWHKNKGFVYKAHRLVALAFIGEPPTKDHVIAHWDGNKANNIVTNLRWATRKENEADKIRHGKHGFKLTEEAVLAIRKLYKEGMSLRVIARYFGVNFSNIHKVVTYRIWDHV